MKTLWLLVGKSDAPGWKVLESDSKAEKVDLVIFDREEWALIRAETPSTEYEGLLPKAPNDGMYVSEQGFPVYIVGQKEVRRPEDVINAVGGRAKELFEEYGDAILALERAGLAF